MSKKVEEQKEMSNKATQSCGMGMCQSILMQKCGVMRKQNSADVSPCLRISCWEKMCSQLYRDANAATFAKHCANAAHAYTLTDETEACVYIYIV